MSKSNDSEECVLGHWLEFCQALFGDESKATKFIERKIASSPEGENGSLFTPAALFSASLINIHLYDTHMPITLNMGFGANLKKPKSNHEETLRFMADNPKTPIILNYIVPHGYRLVESKAERTSEGEIRTICLVADLGNKVYETVYKTQILIKEKTNGYIIKRNTAQILVWRSVRSSHIVTLNGFEREILCKRLGNYTYLLKFQGNRLSISGAGWHSSLRQAMM